MDQRIFDRLDVLEHGARNGSLSRRDVRGNRETRHSAADDYEHLSLRQSEQDRRREEFDDGPLTLDSFDQQLLRRTDCNSRYGQAALEHTRLSILPGSTRETWQDPSHHLPDDPRAFPGPSRRLVLSRFSFNSDRTMPSSGPHSNELLPSSPTYNASQRRTSSFGHSRNRDELMVSPVQPESRATYNDVAIPQTVETEHDGHPISQRNQQRQEYDYVSAKPTSSSRASRNALPVVQGVGLVSTRELPDRLRAMFPFPVFNAIQSGSFDVVYKTNDNFVLSAPTGSGKTVVLELAICRLINNYASGSCKIVYQAPTKSLCAERQRDWQAKFGPLDLQCAELTGDTDGAQLRNVQHASIIITTPEKWDSMTRKWKDHQKLMEMVKLFLIDEVHILKEDRGATLEAVVSRMKSVGSGVRFIALSATVPNSQDIATWLGKDSMYPHIPAPRRTFGEEFRPVPLQRHVCGYQSSGNDFAFDKVLNGKLTDVIAKWSQHKPLMIFCFTRASCVETAKLLANWWSSMEPRGRLWRAPTGSVKVMDKDLRATISSGIAFHHAGLELQDRTSIEQGYVRGDINVICCTSTLAVGVNLPCHMVIIKNTVTYQSPAQRGCKEYSDLEIMQMLGRAGRPQYDNSAVAVVMTRSQRVDHYEKMMTGQEILESTLHLNLIDHLNAEIGLGTIASVSSAKQWLSGTFLYVRLRENPGHYRIQGDVPDRSLDERLEEVCRKGIGLLDQHWLVRSEPKLVCTEFGDAMARYYVQFDTMKTLLALPTKAKISEILSAVSQAAEFHGIHFRAYERGTYKDLNKNISIKFPIPVNLEAPAHKVSLVIQAVLGAIELPTEDHKVTKDFNAAREIVFSNVHRLVHCIIDCQLYLEDSVTARNALALARSLGAQVWDDSPLHMKQLQGIGLVSVRKLASAGIKSIEDVEVTEAHILEGILSRNPPHGTQLQAKAKAFPKLRVSLKMVGSPAMKDGECVLKIKAEIGFLNDDIPEWFDRKPVYVCLLAETSDGKMLHFARISANKLNKGQDVLFSASLTNASQTIRAHVMCDHIAATARQAIIKPDLPANAFPVAKSLDTTHQQNPEAYPPSTSKRRASPNSVLTLGENQGASDEFGDADIDDATLALAETGVFIDIDDVDLTGECGIEPKAKRRKTNDKEAPVVRERQHQQLANGKWACNHPCKDKTACKHMCCREGLDKKPKPSKPKDNSNKRQLEGRDRTQSQLNVSVSKKTAQAAPHEKSDVKQQGGIQSQNTGSRGSQTLQRLHGSVKTPTRNIPVLGRVDRQGTISTGAQSAFSFLQNSKQAVLSTPNPQDDGADGWNSYDLPSPSRIVDPNVQAHTRPSGEHKADDSDMLDFGLGDHDECYHTQVVAQPVGKEVNGLVRDETDSDIVLHEEMPSPMFDSGLQPTKTASHLFVSSGTGSETSKHKSNASTRRSVHDQATVKVGPSISSESKENYTAPSSHDEPLHPDNTAETGDHSSEYHFLLAESHDEEPNAEVEHPSSSDDLEKWFKSSGLSFSTTVVERDPHGETALHPASLPVAAPKHRNMVMHLNVENDEEKRVGSVIEHGRSGIVKRRL